MPSFLTSFYFRITISTKLLIFQIAVIAIVKITKPTNVLLNVCQKNLSLTPVTLKNRRMIWEALDIRKK